VGALRLLDRAVLSAKQLGYIPRRANITEYKPKPQSHPLYVCEKVASGCGEAFLYAIALEPPAATALQRLGHPDFVTAGTARRGREALHTAGIAQFGVGLERLVLTLVGPYDAACAAGPVSASTALAAAEAVMPREHDAVALVLESPQLTSRPIRPAVTTLRGRPRMSLPVRSPRSPSTSTLKAPPDRIRTRALGETSRAVRNFVGLCRDSGDRAWLTG
jgi:hypothetical protein